MSVASVTVGPRPLAGSVRAVASKSVAHRLVILAALCAGTTEVICDTTSADIEATLSCVEALGATVRRDGTRLLIDGVGGRDGLPAMPALDCGESGSTLRFMLPVVAALGRGGTLDGHGRLAERPLAPLSTLLREHGATISEEGTLPLVVCGAATGGTFELPGNVSSQFVSGLLMAAPLMAEPVSITVTGRFESRPYVTLTTRALAAFGVRVTSTQGVRAGEPFERLDVHPGGLVSPGTVRVEGDWSNAAPWLCAGALSPAGVTVTDLDGASAQGDRAVLAALALLGARVERGGDHATVIRDRIVGCEMDVSDIPDLVPPLAAVAAHAEGTTRLANAGRLRLKESDRLQTVGDVVRALGGDAHVEGDDLVIVGGGVRGGVVDAANDHRIAMMAAVCATAAEGPVEIRDASCVNKSYPRFFDDLASLGGDVRAH